MHVTFEQGRLETEREDTKVKIKEYTFAIVGTFLIVFLFPLGGIIFNILTSYWSYEHEFGFYSLSAAISIISWLFLLMIANRILEDLGFKDFSYRKSWKLLVLGALSGQLALLVGGWLIIITRS